MDLDNANNPFANSNGADDIIPPPSATTKGDGLLLNLSDAFRQNGAGDLFTGAGDKANGKRPASEFDDDDDDDDLGPETDVDAVDEVPAIVQAKALADGAGNNNPEEFNPFAEKEVVDVDFDLLKRQGSEFDGQRSPREETPTPPADAVHDGGLVDNVGDSGEESEDEWNYIKGEEANKENISPSQPDCEVADILEEADSMSQLNPNAAEFVPVSPTRSIPSPACRALINDPVIAQSPKRPSDIDINLPNPQEFENEVKSRPSDFDSYSNGHDNEGDHKPTSQELMENLLNGKNIDDIPEFQPGTTPTKVPSSTDEFHFGPNAAPFTPTKQLDQSETGLSTKAVFGDESTATFDSTFESSTVSKDDIDFTLKAKEEDPMSMSFYQDKTPDSFDLNKVQLLPENLDDFLNKPEDQINVTQDDNISEQHKVSDEILVNNDERIQTTDLDKVADDEKELASPVSNEEDLISGTCELSRSPNPDFIQISENEPAKEDTLKVEICSRPESASPQPDLLGDLCLRPESKSPKPEVYSPAPEMARSPLIQTVSPVPEPVVEEQIPSPEPEQMTESPEPEVVSPAPEVLTPEPQVSSPEPETKILSPEPPSEELCQLLSKSPVVPEAPSPQPTGDICLLSKSPEPEKIASPVPEQLVDVEPAVVETVEEQVDEVCSKSEIEEKREVSLESPVEDVTSSVKDVTSPIESPIPESQLLNFAQEINTPLQDTVTTETSSPIKEEEIPNPQEQCPISTPKSITDTESVLTSDVNSFLNRSHMSDLASPLSPGDQPLYKDGILDTEHPLMRCVYPLPTTEIKTETITPEFAEQTTVASPMEETPTSVPEVKEPEVAKIEETPIATVPAAAPATVVDEKKTAPSKAKPAVKKTSVKAAPGKVAAASPTKVKAATAAPKTRPAPATTAAASKTSRPSLAASKPRAAATTAASRLAAEKKPLTNGDVKVPAPISRTAARKPLESPKTATARTLTAATSKTSPTKAATPRPTTAPVKSPATSKAATGTSSATARSRPNTLVKTSTTGARSATLTATTSRVTATKSTTSPKPTSPPKPRPATAPAAKPRVPITRTVNKTSVDAEKQHKESANKLTASRTMTSAAKSTSATAAKTSTFRKIESKTTGTTRTTVTKTTSTTTTRPGTTASKKPTEITRPAIKTKTTKVEKPIENGVSTVITEQITMVNNVVNESDQQLMKDNSPIDNKLIVETNTAD